MNIFFDQPYILYLSAVLAILVTIILVKIITEKEIVHPETGRKTLHFTAIMICALVVKYTQSWTELAWIFLIFSLVLLFIAHQNLLLPTKRKSYGIALFPLAFGIMLFTKLTIDSIMFGMITLGISDALAGFVGEHYSKKKYAFLYENKSWLGFAAFYCSTLGIGYFYLGFSPLLFVLALIPALAELFSIKGSDNLTVPIMSTLWLVTLQETQHTWIHWAAFSSMVLIFVFAFHKKWLSMTGTTAAFLLGTMIVFSVGPIYLLPIAIFFVSGSLSSKLLPKSKDASGRNAFQVFANGLIAVLTLMVYHRTKNDIFLIASFTSVAVCLADTLSSDIGVYFKQKTYDIMTLKPINAGLSGGISFSGTLAGILGSVIFSLILWTIFKISTYHATIIALGGITGMFFDSIIGSVWQAKYNYKNQIIEEKNEEAILIKGRDWLNNDGVNFISNVCLVLSVMCILYQYEK